MATKTITCNTAMATTEHPVKHRLRKGGKPSLAGIVAPGARTKVVTVALGDHRLEQLRALAAERGDMTLNVSMLIREAVDALLERSA
jgi:hypothetical protein